MTISNTASYATYTGNGSQQIFDVKNGSEGIYFDAASELYVTVRVDDTVTVKSIGTHYTVAGAGTDTGTITFLTAPASGAEVRIERRTPLTQTLNLTSGGAFNPVNVENTFDKVIRALQDQSRGVSGGQANGTYDGDPLTKTASGTAWDGEDLPAQGFADGENADDLVTVGQVNDLLAGNAGNGLFALSSELDSEVATLNANITAAVAAHVALSDPHAQYALEADLASTTDAAKGAALIRMMPSETGGVALPITTILKRLELAPEQFGAAGDGTTDDGTAFTNLIAAAKTNKARIKLRADYNIASVGGSIDFPVHIIGPGKLIRPNNTATPYLSFIAGCDGSILEGVRFSYTHGSTTAGVLHSAVRITAGRGVVVAKCTIDGGGKLYAGLISETTSAVDTLFEGNTIIGVVNRAIYGYLGTKRLVVRSNRIDGGVGGVATTNYGVNLNDGTIAGCIDAVIDGNVILDTVDQGIETGNLCEGTVIANNILRSSSTSGSAILVQISNSNRGRKVLVRNNKTKGWGNGCYIYQTDDFSVIGNTFEDMATAVLVTDSTEGLVAKNNSFNASSCHYWYANGDNMSHLGNRSKGGAATYDLIQDASSDRFRYNDNARNGGSGVYSVAGTNISAGTNT